MLKGLVSLLLCIFIYSSSFAQNNGTVQIADVISLISKDSVVSTITSLENFTTRFMLAPNRFAVADWIKGEFEKMGFVNVELDSFQCATIFDVPPRGMHVDTITTQVNVIATLPGTETPDEIYIICGHYDCYADNANPIQQAPGADDNASGTTAVLESARAIMAAGYQPKSTLKFIAFAAEELMFFGDAGSEHYSAMAAERGDNIKLVINNDMIGNSTPNAIVDVLNIGHESYSGINTVRNYASTYSNLLINTSGYCGADLLGFFEHGYEGIYFEESEFNFTNYHKTTDTIANLYKHYCTEAIKASCAVLLGMQLTVTDVEDNPLPAEFALEQNYPNPFNPSTIISFNLADQSRVVLKVYDLLGREVAELINGEMNAGIHKVDFNGANLSSGIYFYTLSAANFTQSRKMTLLR